MGQTPDAEAFRPEPESTIIRNLFFLRRGAREATAREVDGWGGQHESKNKRNFEMWKDDRTHTHTHTARGTRGNDVAGRAIFAKLADPHPHSGAGGAGRS